MTKRVLLIGLFSVMLSSQVLAVGYYASGVTGVWDNPVTWGGAGYPVVGDTAYLNLGSTVNVDGTDESVYQIHFASWSGNSDLVTLNITNSGSLTVSDWAYLGVADGDVGEMNVVGGGTFTCDSAMNVGFNGTCTLNVNGGTVNANGGLFTPNPWQAAGTGVGTINVIDGIINVSTDFAMGSSGLINIEYGKIKIYGLWYDTLLTGYITGNQIIGFGGTSSVVLSHEGDYTILSAVDPLQPDPVDDATLSAGSYTMRWVLPEPEVSGGSVSCDVYFTDDYPAAGTPGDPNFTDYAAKIVDAQVQESIVRTLEANKDYYWRIDIYDTSSSEPQPAVGHVLHFDTKNQAPTANAGADVYTWLTGGVASVDLLGSVTDDGLPGPYTVQWQVTSEPVADDAQLDPVAGDQLAVNVTMTQLGDYVLELTADDGQRTGSDSVVIHVYEDNCKAAQGAGIALYDSDLNADCVVDLLDLALFASEWLLDMSL